MRTTLLFLLLAAGLAWAGEKISRSNDERSRKSETFEVCIAQMEKDAALLPLATSAAVNAARASADSLAAQWNALPASFQAASASRSLALRASKIEEASAKRAQTHMVPSLRHLLTPLPANASLETIAKRSCETAFLDSLLAAGIEDVDFLELAEQKTELPGACGQTSSLRIRVRARLAEISKWMARVSATPESLPMHRIEKVELRALASENSSTRPQLLVDFHIETLLPEPPRETR